MSLEPAKAEEAKPSREARRLERERKARKHAEQLLETRSRELYESKLELEKAYIATVEVFASLLSDRRARTSEDLRKMATHAKLLCRFASLSDEKARTMHLATVLCDIGKLALPDALVDKPFVQLKPEEMRTFQTHPQLAHDALLALPPLADVADVILFHCERLDGGGYPNKVKGTDIPVESRILAIVKDFDALQRGIIVRECLTESEALKYLRTHAGKRYDKELVAAFANIIESKEDHFESLTEQRLTPSSLMEGMMITRDLTNEKGLLVIPAGQKLTLRLIEKLRHMEEARPGQILVYVRDEDVPDEEEPGASSSETPPPQGVTAKAG